MRVCLFLFVFSTCPLFAHAEISSERQVRKLQLKRDDIALVRTAVGIATIIQVPDRPTSVVLGDANAFKVEYLETAITIKPLNHSSKSNLYIYTEARRFNVNLVTAPQGAADYIVYLDSERESLQPPKEQWRKFSAEKSNGAFRVTIHRLGVVADFLALEFSISSQKEMNFGPEWIWVTQNGKTIPIQGLNLSGVKISPKIEILGGLMIRRGDLLNREALVMEVRSSAPISIKLPGAQSWMR